jgi:hypothetical protein
MRRTRRVQILPNSQSTPALLATLEFVPQVCTSSHPFDLETRTRVLIGNEAGIWEHMYTDRNS